MREATGYLRLALDHSDQLSASERAARFQDYAWTSYQIGQIEDAIRAEKQALEFFVSQGEITIEGDSYRRLSRFFWLAADGVSAKDYADKAILTHANQRGPELTMAQSTVAQLAMLDFDYNAVIGPSTSAMQLAEEFDRPDTLAHCLNNLGMSYVWSDPDYGRRSAFCSAKDN